MALGDLLSRDHLPPVFRRELGQLLGWTTAQSQRITESVRLYDTPRSDPNSPDFPLRLALDRDGVRQAAEASGASLLWRTWENFAADHPPFDSQFFGQDTFGGAVLVGTGALNELAFLAVVEVVLTSIRDSQPGSPIVTPSDVLLPVAGPLAIRSLRDALTDRLNSRILRQSIQELTVEGLIRLNQGKMIAEFCRVLIEAVVRANL